MTAPSTAPAPQAGEAAGSSTGTRRTRRSGTRPGRRPPSRNLFFSVLSEHIGFSIWTLWSVMVLFMGPEYGLTPADKFMLIVSMATLVGAVVRVPYTFAVADLRRPELDDHLGEPAARCPTVAAFAVMEPGTSFTTFLLCAMLAGVGGGNFASA